MNRLIILKRFALGALLVGILGSSFPSHAQEMFGRWTAAEVLSLPQYCQDNIIRVDKEKYRVNTEKWRRALGWNGWAHLHHYCYGLLWYSAASREIDSFERAGFAQRGIAEFSYVLKGWPADFQLYPLAQMYKEQLEIMMKFSR